MEEGAPGTVVVHTAAWLKLPSRDIGAPLERFGTRSAHRADVGAESALEREPTGAAYLVRRQLPASMRRRGRNTFCRGAVLHLRKWPMRVTASVQLPHPLPPAQASSRLMVRRVLAGRPGLLGARWQIVSRIVWRSRGVRALTFVRPRRGPPALSRMRAMAALRRGESWGRGGVTSRPGAGKGKGSCCGLRSRGHQCHAAPTQEAREMQRHGGQRAQGAAGAAQAALPG